ncbi:MAG: GPR endopeptidase [Clostridia bacterium]|nr:GPR endopeptidase [Clostridia bacterium]
MSVRTDIAVEFMADKTQSEQNVKVKKYDVEGIEVTNVEILNDAAAKEIGKPCGKYVTLEAKEGMNIFDSDMLRELLIAEIRGLVGAVEGDILVVGVGNKTVTPDALGPKAAAGVFATRHISEPLRKQLGLSHMASVSVICPGVLGQTGMEAKEIIEGAVERVDPKAIIIIDALAAREVSRLGRTVQLSNTGLAPGSGVGNSRTELSEKTLGVKCVTVGVPTVVDASTLSFDLTGKKRREHEPLIVTPRDIDRMVERSSQVIATAVNIALQPENAYEILSSCV